DREATEQEQQANALKAQAVRDASIKQAGFQAEIDRASAQAKQAGPLTEATAHQEVVVQQTKVAELEAQREEQSLQATVRKPADAKAYEQVTLARAERDARISGAEAERQEVELARDRRGGRQAVRSDRPDDRAERSPRPVRGARAGAQPGGGGAPAGAQSPGRWQRWARRGRGPSRRLARGARVRRASGRGLRP